MPSRNIKVITNKQAEENELLELVEDWLPRATKAGSSDVYVFFAGHGLSSADGKKVYLFPYNGLPKLLDKTALHRSELFTMIAKAKPRSVMVFLDTCYSGTTRSEEIIVASRGIRIVPKVSSISCRFHNSIGCFPQPDGDDSRRSQAWAVQLLPDEGDGG